MKTITIRVLVSACAILAIATMGRSNLQSQTRLNKRRTMSIGFLLSAHLEKSRVKTHETVLIKLSIKNGSKSVLYLVETSPEKEYSLDVRDSRGESVKLTEAGQRLLENKDVDFRVIGVKVKPGAERLDAVDIGKFYDVSAPGTYQIKAIRKVKNPKAQVWTEVVSNTVTLTVVL
jgi:hypothetical protein